MAKTTSRPDVEQIKRSPVQLGAFAVGIVFILVGVAGFIPGITTNYDAMEWAGHESEAMLFDLFQVSVLHNVVHLAFGVAGILMAAKWDLARAFLIGGGAIYLVLWVYGLAIDHDSEANFIPVNTAADWLHFGLGVGMIALGLILPRMDATVGEKSSGRTAGRTGTRR